MKGCQTLRNIEIKLLNDYVLYDIEKMMVCAARLTQRGPKIENMQDFELLLSKDYTESLVETLSRLPHDTIQRFGVINVAVVGASRRFLAQITRHQVGVTFMSASLQYSDYSEGSKFVVPYEIIEADAERKGYAQYVAHYHENEYIKTCEAAVENYTASIAQGIPHDAAAYMQPHGLRNVLIISGNAQAFRHMISIRTCRRNSLETQYVMLRIWEELIKRSNLFNDCGPACLYGSCPEGKMSCGMPVELMHPTAIIESKFKHLYKEEK